MTASSRSSSHPDPPASFEGPLDLLLHLIKKHEVNVYDIPIALITEQYLEYLGSDAGAESRRGRASSW